MSALAVLGAGSWGTVLAWLFATNGHSVALWARSAALAAQVDATRTHERAMPGLRLPAGVAVTADLARALESAGIAFFAVPAAAVRDVAMAAAPHLARGAVAISCAKGFEEGSNLRMSEVLAAVLPAARERILALSGPNLAGEIAEGKATASVVACADIDIARAVQEQLSSPRLRLYTNPDVIGVEYGGALKNCIAIAAGVADGLQMGANAHAALVTRGLAELARLGTAAGAQPLTFSGLAGLGDLLATSSSPRSRNYQVGLRLAAGERWPAIAKQLGHVAEGVPTTRVARALAARYGVRTPIIDRAYEVLFAGRPVVEALEELVTSVPHDELAGLRPEAR